VLVNPIRSSALSKFSGLGRLLVQAAVLGGALSEMTVAFWRIVLKKSPKTGKAPIRFEIETKISNKNNAKNISVCG
jgi:hypothetical protein